MTKQKNFTGKITPSIIDDEYFECNFCHPNAIDSGGGVWIGVRIFPDDDTPITFIECNLVNAEAPPGSTLTRCNTAIIQRGIVTSTESITIDGETINIDHHKDIFHGNWTPDGYVYKDTPVDMQVD